MEDALLTAPRYYWGCCQVCKKSGTAKEQLKRCSRCSCLFYCSKEHQKSDWKNHKKLCSYLATAAEEVGAETFFGHQLEFDEEDDECQEIEERPNDKVKSWKSWAKFRVNAVRTCEILMGRPLEQFEKEVFLFPRACRVCRLAKRDGMLDCPDCRSTTYCSKQHQEEHLDKHRKEFCSELKYAMVCDNYESTVSISAPAVSEHLDKQFKDLTEMSQHLDFHLKNHINTDVDLAEMEFRFLSDRLSSPLTVVYCASKYGLARGQKVEDLTELTVHIAGSNIVEMLGIIKWEYIMHRLPKLAKLHLVFIGLELDDEDSEGESPDLSVCSRCSDEGRQIKYDIRKMSYKKYFNHCAEYVVPDIVCAFNCGFHEFANEPEKETWKPSLPFLTKHKGVPLIFTSYTWTESKRDYDLIRQESQHEIGTDECMLPNPFRSYRPVRDFEYENDRDVFYSNQYYSVVRQI